MERLSEAIETLKGKVIEENGHYVVKDVVLLSEFSKNKSPSGKPRRYLAKAMKESLNKFDGLQINVNHPPIVRDPNSATGASVLSSQRDVLAVIGRTTNPRLKKVKEGDRTVHKVLGDIELVKSPSSEHIVQLINLDPKLAGMSITGDGELSESDQFLEVTTLEPSTVDVVHRPATTQGFFESYFSPEMKKDSDKLSYEDAKKYAEAAKVKAEAAAKKAGEEKTPELYVTAAMRYREAGRLCQIAAYKALEAGDVAVNRTYIDCERNCSDVSYQLDRLARDKVEGDCQMKEAEMRSLETIFEEILDDEKELDIAELEDDDEEEEDEDLDDEDFEDEDEGEDLDEEPDDEDLDLEDEDDEDLELEDEDIDDEDLDMEGMEGEDLEGMQQGGMDPEAAKEEAIQASRDANNERTATAHTKAKFANYLAAGLMAQSGDFNRASGLEEVAKQHDAVARKLKASEKPENPQPSPEGQQAAPEQVMQATEVLQRAGSLSENRLTKLPNWLQEVYDESKHKRDEGGKFSTIASKSLYARSGKVDAEGKGRHYRAHMASKSAYKSSMNTYDEGDTPENHKEAVKAHIQAARHHKELKVLSVSKESKKEAHETMSHHLSQARYHKFRSKVPNKKQMNVKEE